MNFDYPTGPSHRDDVQAAVAEATANLRNTYCVICRALPASEVVTGEIHSPESGVLVMPVCEWCVEMDLVHPGVAVNDVACFIVPPRDAEADALLARLDQRRTHVTRTPDHRKAMANRPKRQSKKRAQPPAEARCPLCLGGAGMVGRSGRNPVYKCSNGHQEFGAVQQASANAERP